MYETGADLYDETLVMYDQDFGHMGAVIDVLALFFCFCQSEAKFTSVICTFKNTDSYQYF
jgi:hypothetical protein